MIRNVQVLIKAKNTIFSSLTLRGSNLYCLIVRQGWKSIRAKMNWLVFVTGLSSCVAMIVCFPLLYLSSCAVFILTFSEKTLKLLSYTFIAIVQVQEYLQLSVKVECFQDFGESKGSGG